jgi:hypothetical protein
MRSMRACNPEKTLNISDLLQYGQAKHAGAAASFW